MNEDLHNDIRNHARQKKIGIILIILPPFLLVGAIIGYTVTHAILQGFLLSNPNLESRTVYFTLLQFVLGLAGLFGIVGLFTSIPAGIYLLSKKTKEDEKKEISSLQNDERYQNLSVEQINFIRRWSWGAFFGQLVWPLGNKLFLWSLVTFIPFFNIYAWIKLSLHGRKMAWEKGGWKNFEQFKKRQKIMTWIIIIFFFFMMIFPLLVPQDMEYSPEKQKLSRSETPQNK